MLRCFAVCVLALTAAVAVRADDEIEQPKDDKGDVVRGEVKKVDTDKGVLTVFVKEKNREEKFTIPLETKITVAVGGRIEEPTDGLKNQWFRSADKAFGSGGFIVEVSRQKKGDKAVVTKVHLKTPS
jgi:hypothetical protein